MKPRFTSRWFSESLIGLLALTLFLPFIGNVHLFDWDEINFAESAREMIVTGDYLTVRINFKPFWEKPPMFIWMQALSMKLFGTGEFAARFPNVVCGIFTLILIYRAGCRIYDHRFGWFWVLAWTGSLLPFIYFKSGIIDPWFNYFIFAGLFQVVFLPEIRERVVRYRRIVFAGVLIGLAILTKGPVALLIFMLTVMVYWLLDRYAFRIPFRELILFFLATGLVGGMWFILQALAGNYHVIAGFIDYHIRLFRTRDAGHGGFFLYHFVVIFLGVFPASVFALPSFARNYFDGTFQKKFKRWMLILFWVVLILFTMVRTKIVHYSSLAYYPVTFLGAIGLYNLYHRRLRSVRWFLILTLSMGFLYGLAVAGIPVIMQNKEWVTASGLIGDPFALGNLQAPVRWPARSMLPGLLYLLLLLVITCLVFGRGIIRSAILIFPATALFVFYSLVVFVPRIEHYSQRTAIEFYREKQDEDCYVNTLGFKSYAHLFYTRKKIPGNPDSYDQKWLLRGELDKPAYFVTRNYKKDHYLKEYPGLELLYEENGFVFLARFPEQDYDRQ